MAFTSLSLRTHGGNAAKLEPKRAVRINNMVIFDPESHSFIDNAALTIVNFDSNVFSTIKPNLPIFYR